MILAPLYIKSDVEYHLTAPYMQVYAMLLYIYIILCSHLAVLTLSSHHCPCKDGMNALCLAICGNHPDVVKLLVDEFNMSVKVKSPVSN